MAEPSPTKSALEESPVLGPPTLVDPRSLDDSPTKKAADLAKARLKKERRPAITKDFFIPVDEALAGSPPRRYKGLAAELEDYQRSQLKSTTSLANTSPGKVDTSQMPPPPFGTIKKTTVDPQAPGLARSKSNMSISSSKSPSKAPTEGEALASSPPRRYKGLAAELKDHQRSQLESTTLSAPINPDKPDASQIQPPRFLTSKKSVRDLKAPSLVRSKSNMSMRMSNSPTKATQEDEPNRTSKTLPKCGKIPELKHKGSTTSLLSATESTRLKAKPTIARSDTQTSLSERKAGKPQTKADFQTEHRRKLQQQKPQHFSTKPGFGGAISRQMNKLSFVKPKTQQNQPLSAKQGPRAKDNDDDTPMDDDRSDEDDDDNRMEE